MKKIRVVLIIIFMMVCLGDVIKAHPGRTDGNGCHVCRTNCEKWGLSYQEYHCHNGGNSNQNTNQNNYQAPIAPSVDYAAQGDTDGYSFKKQYPNATIETVTYKFTSDIYKTAYDEGYRRALQELNVHSQTKGSLDGEKDANIYESYAINLEQKDVILSIYEKNYKDAFDLRHKELVDNTKAIAKKNAYNEIFNEVTLEKPQLSIAFLNNIYYENYTDLKANYKKEKKDTLKKATLKGKEHGNQKDEKNLNFLDKYKSTLFYKDAVSNYNKAYKLGYENSETTQYDGYVYVLLCILMFLVIKHFRKKHKLKI